MYEPIEVGSRSRRTFTAAGRILGALKLDGPLLVGLGLITLYGLVVLYSASGQNWNRVIDGAIRAALGGFAMCALAQVKPAFLRRLALPLWIARRHPADRRRHHRPHRQGRAALARSRVHPLPALRNHEARGAHDLRVVAARSAAAAGLEVAAGARDHHPAFPPASPSCSRTSAPAASSSSAACWW